MKRTSRQASLKCYQLHQKYITILIFYKILLLSKITKYINIINDNKAMVYISLKYCKPAIKYLHHYRLLSLKRMKMMMVILKYYKKKMMCYGARLLHWNVQYMRRTKRLALWY